MLALWTCREENTRQHEKALRTTSLAFVKTHCQNDLIIISERRRSWRLEVPRIHSTSTLNIGPFSDVLRVLYNPRHLDIYVRSTDPILLSSGVHSEFNVANG